jgi:NADH-quinone oxidoreductase subunit N
MDAFQTINEELLTFSSAQLNALQPYFLVIGGALLAVIAAVFKKLSAKWFVFIISLLTAGVGMFTSAQLLGLEAIFIFNNMMISDQYSHFLNIVFWGAALVTLVMSFKYLDKEGLQHPEYYVLILFSTIGMMLMASALDLIVMFIALELMSLTVYTLVSFRRSDRRSNEAAMKYFILGGAASAIFLYGSSLLYGVTGTTNIQDIVYYLHIHPGDISLLFTLGSWLVIAGFLFKVAIVPFHMWMPDVYEGAPTPITAFMATGVKVASFAVLLRLVSTLGYGDGLSDMVQQHLHDVLWVAALLTMVVGNVIALTQNSLKRMLAYSSIAHTGYALVGIIAAPGSQQGYSPVLIYLVIYTIMNLGAFIVLSILSEKADTRLNLQDMAGVARQHPFLAFSMAVFLFSMAGIPPAAGFVGKYMLFYSAVQAGEVLLVVLAVLCSVISVYYYLRVLVFMYMKEPVAVLTGRKAPFWSIAALVAMVILTLQLGILPSGLIELARTAAASL